jgi:hypothetical protein
LARNSKAMLNRSGECGHPCLIPYFSRNGFSYSPFSIMLAMGMSYISFILLRNIPSIPSFTVFSTNVAGKTEYSHVEDWN